MCCPHACPSIDIIIDSGPEFPMLALNYGVRIYFPKNESDAPYFCFCQVGESISEDVLGTVEPRSSTSAFVRWGKAFQQKCSQYFSLYLIGISLISGSSKGPTLVAVFTKLFLICAYSLKYRFALVLMFFLQKKLSNPREIYAQFSFFARNLYGDQLFRVFTTTSQ